MSQFDLLKFLSPVVVCLVAYLASVSVCAEDAQDAPPEARTMPRHLIRPGAMTGWSGLTEDRQAVGWTVEGDRLIGGRESQPLVADWTFGDFEVQLRWQAKADGILHLQLSEELKNENDAVHIQIVLHEGDDCGRILRGEKPLAKGKPVDPMDKPHQARVKRWQDKLEVFVDDEKVSETNIDAKQRFQLSLHVPAGVVSVSESTVTEPLGEPLFNGEDLTGWWSQRKQDGWKVEDGELVGQRKGGNYLRSEREFGNFTFNFDYKISEGGNSGVGIRTPRNGWPSGQGMELQILDRDSTDAGSQMSIYKHFPPLERPDQSETWNNVVIKADGRIITAWVNGQIAQHRDTSTNKKLADKPLSGWIGFQDHGAVMRIRNVYVLEAPARAVTNSHGGEDKP